MFYVFFGKKKLDQGIAYFFTEIIYIIFNIFRIHIYIVLLFYSEMYNFKKYKHFFKILKTPSSISYFHFTKEFFKYNLKKCHQTSLKVLDFLTIIAV